MNGQLQNAKMQNSNNALHAYSSISRVRVTVMIRLRLGLMFGLEFGLGLG